MIQPRNFLLTLFTLLFAVLFGGTLFETLWTAPPDGLQRRYLWLCMAAWACITFAIHRVLNQWLAYQTHKIQTITLCVGLALLLVAYLSCGFALAVNMAWDTEAVFRGAEQIARQGALGRYHHYFHQFPNNLPATYLLSAVFSLGIALGVDELRNLGILINVLALWLSALLLYHFAQHFGSRRHAAWALVLFSGCIPVYFYTPIFYTDTLSMPFVIAVPFLYLRLLDKPNWSAAVLLGTCICAGTLIKATVLITALAIAIHWLVFVRSYSIHLLTSCLVSTALFFGAYAKISPILDDAQQDRLSIPWEHWVMMGLKGNGGYNPSDYEFTKARPSLEEKREANRAEIRRRLADMGWSGSSQHLWNKAQASLAHGHFAVSSMIDDGPLHNTWLHKIGISGQPYHRDFLYVSQSFQNWLLLVITLATVLNLLQKAPPNHADIVSRGAIFGFVLFLAFWEASPRYMLNALPLLIALFAAGVCSSKTKASAAPFTSQ